MLRIALISVAAFLFISCTAGTSFTPSPSPRPSPSPVPSQSPGPSPSSSPSPSPIPPFSPSPPASPVPDTPFLPSPQPVPAAVAVYLSIGDSIQYGCCHDPKQSAGEIFRAYLGQKLGRPVEWITTADNGTAHDFVGATGQTDPQLQRALRTIRDLQDEGRPIVAITMSIGGNDYVEVGGRCPNPPCLDVFVEILNRMKGDLDQIYPAIAAAKPANTPLMVVMYYNAQDCGQPDVATSPTETGQLTWNAVISQIATKNGAFMVDAHTPFEGRACQLIEGVDPNYEGYKVLAAAYEKAYEALPSEYVTPFELP